MQNLLVIQQSHFWAYSRKNGRQGLGETGAQPAGGHWGTCPLLPSCWPGAEYLSHRPCPRPQCPKRESSHTPAHMPFRLCSAPAPTVAGPWAPHWPHGLPDLCHTTSNHPFIKRPYVCVSWFPQHPYTPVSLPACIGQTPSHPQTAETLMTPTPQACQGTRCGHSGHRCVKSIVPQQQQDRALEVQIIVMHTHMYWQPPAKSGRPCRRKASLGSTDRPAPQQVTLTSATWPQLPG